MWVELVAETTPALRESDDSSGNPPVTQVTTPVTMQKCKASYNLNGWVIKKFTPLTVVMKCKICYIDQNHFLYQAVNIHFPAVMLGILGAPFTAIIQIGTDRTMWNITLNVSERGISDTHRMPWGWVNLWLFYIFGWTIPLSLLWPYIFCFERKQIPRLCKHTRQ